ncbi:MAG: AMP-binding protein, partial [Leptolyngbyaceae cyanobacterium bins.302]|nr:AMP-binding protein [Leptolyngbyaceae cyanobacterium bins.302]
LTILLGGAPAWKDLLEAARKHQLPIAPTYGMTETASQIATLKPEEFLQGRSSCGRVLPHARVTIRDEAGNPLAANQVGRVAIAAKSLMLGYFPHASMQPEFLTEDLGFLDEAGYLHIVGRRDCTIITGGENVFPAEVEAAIRASGLVKDVYVLGTPDPDWGQAVTAVYVSAQDATREKLKAAIASHLCRYKHPKHWVAVEELPRNAQGKVNRQRVMALLNHALHNPPTTSA